MQVTTFETRDMSRIEMELAYIWSSLLKIDVESIGPESNFFEIGGTSLLVGFLVREINSTASGPSQISFKDIFEHSSLEQMAKTVESRREEAEARLSNDNGSLTLLTLQQKYIWFTQIFKLGEENPSYCQNRIIPVTIQSSFPSILSDVMGKYEAIGSDFGSKSFKGNSRPPNSQIQTFSGLRSSSISDSTLTWNLI
jgi:hypothetical protein